MLKKWHSGGQQGQNTASAKTKIFSTRGVTFSDAIRSFQTYINKSLSGSHIKYMLLGEDFCKEDISLGIDFNARDYEVRLSAGIYITKESKARDFISKSVNSAYSIDEKILSMEKNNEAKNVSYETNVLELLSMLARKNSCGLVPTLEIISEKGNDTPSKGEEGSDNVQDFQTGSVQNEKDVETFFDFGGYAIIDKRKLVGYLSREDSITCNIMKNRAGGTNINIDLGENEIVSFALLNSVTGYDFKFDGDKISEVIVNTEIKTNVEEVSTLENIFKYEKLKELEQKQAEQIKREIEKVIEKMKEFKCDFISINDNFKMKHPYRYEKIRENWSEELLKAKFTVNVNAKTLRTYDILNIQDE